MYYDDHQPPHFHARYQDHRAAIALDGILLAGSLPRIAMGLVEEWASLHHEELIQDWKLAQGHEPLKLIPPLP